MRGEPRCVSGLGYMAVTALHAPHALRARPRQDGGEGVWEPALALGVTGALATAG